MKNLPPFPEGVPTATIARISYAKLLSGDDVERAELLQACKKHGFFYMDLRHSPRGQALLDETDKIIDLAPKFFNLPLETKKKYAIVKGKSMAGYKEAGSTAQTDKDKKPDRTEFLNIFKDHIHNISGSREYPDIFLQEESTRTIEAFNQNAHAVGMTVLEALARELSLPSAEFTGRHVFYNPSEDQLRLTNTAPSSTTDASIGLAPHTDFGSVTVLFNWLGGLQIQNSKGEWVYVRPIPGHAIINLGDAMVVFSNGHLKSAKHRVNTAPGEQGRVLRNSLMYFVRPNDDVLLEPLDHFPTVGSNELFGGELPGSDGRIYKASEWVIKRAADMGAWNQNASGAKTTVIKSRL